MFENMSVVNKAGEIEKATSSYGNSNAYNASHSSASVHEESSDESIDINRDPFATKKEKLNQIHATDGIVAQNNVTGWCCGASDLESPDSATNMVKMAQNSGMILNASSTGAMLTKEDDHELKLAKRRQSNRESARRSRLRKQEALKNLQAAVEELKAERSVLKEKLSSLSEECAKLKDENESIMEGLKVMRRLDAIASRKASTPGFMNHESYRSKRTIQSEEHLTLFQRRHFRQ